MAKEMKSVAKSDCAGGRNENDHNTETVDADKNCDKINETQFIS